MALPTKSSSPKSTAQTRQRFPPLLLQSASVPRTICLKPESEVEWEMALVFKAALDTSFQR